MSGSPAPLDQFCCGWPFLVLIISKSRYNGQAIVMAGMAGEQEPQGCPRYVATCFQ